MNINLTAPSGAVIDGQYRYLLWRHWADQFAETHPQPGGWLTWVMLNPSTADENTDDPTIRKCIGFAKRAGFSGILVANLFGWRATNPKHLRVLAANGTDLVGPRNRGHLGCAFHYASALVFAWGAVPRGLKEHDQAARVARQTAKMFHATPRCLGRTKGGEPRHPLMLSYSTPLEVW